MKKLIPYLIVLTLSLSGCQSTKNLLASFSNPTEQAAVVPANPDTDPIVVNAEKTLAVARDTFRFIAHEERKNEALFAKVSPSVHDFVQHIRTDGVKWLRTAEAMKTAYKSNRSPENQRNLVTAVSTVSEALNQSKQYLSMAGFKTN